MVNQTLISFKVDSNQLVLLDSLCSRLGVKRNKFLNFLVSYGINMMRDFDKFSILSVYSYALSSSSD